MRILLILFLFFSITGCWREKTITGEIFIVTQGGQNYKLGLVNVGLVDAETLTPHIEGKLKTAKDSVSLVYVTYGQMKDSIALLSSLSDELEKKENNLDYDDHQGKLVLLNRLISISEKKMSLYLRIVPYENTYNKFASGDFFLNRMPRLEDSSKTDSEGYFSFVVNRDKKYFIVASASRSVGDSKEHYYWIVEYPSSSVSRRSKNLVEQR